MFCLTLPIPALSWDGYDYESGSDVEIGKGNLVRQGKEIEFYDYGSGDYKSGEVQSVKSRGNKVEVEVIDSVTGNIRTLEMKKK
jgi:pyruvate/2-oxoglutarate/acetoin dehydrogenase E1 component